MEMTAQEDFAKTVVLPPTSIEAPRIPLHYAERINGPNLGINGGYNHISMQRALGDKGEKTDLWRLAFMTHPRGENFLIAGVSNNFFTTVQALSSLKRIQTPETLLKIANLRFSRENRHLISALLAPDQIFTLEEVLKRINNGETLDRATPTPKPPAAPRR
jgi:hypothetical protein